MVVVAVGIMMVTLMPEAVQLVAARLLVEPAAGGLDQVARIQATAAITPAGAVRVTKA